MTAQSFSSHDIPDRVTAFAEIAAGDDFFRSLDWFRVAWKTTSLSGDQARLYVAERRERPVAALAASERQNAGQLRAHMLFGVGQGPYTPTYGPLLDSEHGAAGLREITMALAEASPPYDVLRFGGLDTQAADCAALLDAFRASGMIVHRFANFQNWSEDVRGLTFAQYLARRPPHIRAIAEHGSFLGVLETASPRFELLSGAAALGAPLIDYALVDLQSPNPPEPHPECVPETAVAAAGRGLLRLGILYIDDRPAAAQIWIVSGGRATQWRQRYVAGGGGPIRIALTLEMLRSLFDSDCITEVEFSRDSSDAAADWASHCDARVGIIVTNPRTAKGLLAAARHIGGHWAMTAARRTRLAVRRGQFG